MIGARHKNVWWMGAATERFACIVMYQYRVDGRQKVQT